MRRGVFIGLIFLLPVLVFANSGNTGEFSAESNLKTFLSSGQYKAQSIQSFNDFLRKLDKKQENLTERAFINYIFNKTHQRFLKNYSAYASLEETFDDGSYNCLTGTILLSLTLHHYKINHEVIETNYHIFILAETDEGKILLEATDAENGFVTSSDEIDSRIALYKQNQVQAEEGNKVYYKYQLALYNSVSLQELRGLTHYNKAVYAFNQKNLEQAVQHLIQANELYCSNRMDEFSQILLLSLKQSDLDIKTKENCMTAILLLRQKSLAALIASR